MPFMNARALVSFTLPLLLLPALTTLAKDRGPQEMLALRPGVPVVVDPIEPLPVRKAAEDLRRDLAKVFGETSPLRPQAPAAEEEIAIIISSRGNEASIAGPESHAMIVRDGHVHLLGSDVRGAIYAIYSFSDEVLGIPPWWFWARWAPEPQDEISIPGHLNQVWSAPDVRWRGWFPNDTDLLSPWLQEDYEVRWDAMLETMLRLKLNLLDIGEFSGKSLRKLRLPRDRGLAVTTTHMAPFGATLRNWDGFWKEHRPSAVVPPLRLDDTDDLETFWKHHIELAQREKVEMVWTIAFRGDGDRGFYRTFPGAPDSAPKRAEVIESMLRRQLDLLRASHGGKLPPVRTVFYDEVSDYLGAGLLTPPRAPDLIWNFTAARRDHFPATDVLGKHFQTDQRIGYYFNLQFTSSGSHLADGEGPWKLDRNHRMLLDSGGDFELGIVNSGNTREFTLGLEAHARLLWDLDSFRAGPFVDSFSQRYWGPEHGPAIATLYREFYDAYWCQRPSDLQNFPRQYIFHDLRIARASRDLLKAATDLEERSKILDERDSGFYRIGDVSEGIDARINALVTGVSASAERFANVAAQCDKIAPRLPDQGAAFFHDGLKRQAKFMTAASRCLLACADGYRDRASPVTYREAMQRAMIEIKSMESALAPQNEGDFAKWYSTETIFGVAETKGMVQRRLDGNLKPLP